MTDASNTGPEQARRPGTFTKGDPRINRRGRPKSFDKLRALAQSLANEEARTKEGVPIVVDGHIATQAEMIMRDMMRANPERFAEIAYGKVPQPIQVSGDPTAPLEIVIRYVANSGGPAGPAPGAEDNQE